MMMHGLLKKLAVVRYPLFVIRCRKKAWGFEKVVLPYLINF